MVIYLEKIMSKNVLVTGGSGLVGTHLKDIMPDAIYISSKDFDLTDINRVDEMMEFYNPSVVVHLAARVGGLLDNMNYPVDYLEENILMNTNVIKSCYKYNVKKCISILSTCIFPDKTEYPINEEMLHLGDPHNSNIGYSYAKRMLEVQSRIYREQYGRDFTCIIPTNIYGKHDQYNLEDSHVFQD